MNTTNDGAVAKSDAPDRAAAPESRAWASFCNGLAQYAAAIAAAALVLTVFFPGNRFLPVPWQNDDYYFMAVSAHMRSHCGVEFFCTRPVSTNVLWRLGMLGETPFYVAMFLLAALIPVLAVHLALRLFRCQPGPRIVVLLVAGVSACTFLFEQSLWFYRYTGLVTNLTSVVLGLLAAQAFGTWLDGRRAGFATGSLLFFASAFAKEDMLLFVPLYVGAEWCIRRWQGEGGSFLRLPGGGSCEATLENRAARPLGASDVPPFSRLASAYGAIAAVGGLLFAWNRWIVPSPFTNADSGPYKLDHSLHHIARQVWGYVVASEVTKMAFAALLLAGLVGVCRRRQRLAALAMLPLTMAMVLPYTVLPRFFEYYSLNWISLVIALAVVCAAAVCRDWLPRRFAIVAWAAPVAILAAAFVLHPGAADFRRVLAAWLNRQQADCQYVLAQLERNREQLAAADTIVVRGADETFSPWLLTDGAYVDMKLGHDVRWLFVIRPQSLAAKFLDPKALPSGKLTVVFDKDLPSYSPAAVLHFDKDLNMSVERPADQKRTAREPSAVR